MGNVLSSLWVFLLLVVVAGGPGHLSLREVLESEIVSTAGRAEGEQKDLSNQPTGVDGQ